ncbi:Hypothetical predicted protein [Octopus vulgaris]|uniref:Uncharacterized protein n=1 Tax=Octopus vulgaris TaxID=6645 RepID=A0AA36AZQ5_OCTVU|nr:Hypothetical predicted protein [Octopus vulgaris]
MQQKEHASIVPITPAPQNIAGPSRINTNISNIVSEHRIPTLLKDFTQITHNITSTQIFAPTSSVNQLNLSSVSTSTVSLSSNINLRPCLPNSVGLPPVPISHLPPLPAESNANILTLHYEVKLINSGYNVLSNYASTSKILSQSQPVIHNSNKYFSSSQKEKLQAAASIAIADITVDSSAEDYNRYFSLISKQTSQVKRADEPALLVKDICSSETKKSQRSDTKLISNHLKNTVSTNIVVEHVPIIESSYKTEPAETKQRTLVCSHLGEAEKCNKS